MTDCSAIEWAHFGWLESELFDLPVAFIGKRVCKECLAKETYLSKCCKLGSNTSVSNAKYHLRIVHNIVYDNSKRKISTTDYHYLLVLKCCLDYSSFNSIQNEGNLKLMQTIRSDLNVPSGNYLVQHVLPKVFDLFKNFLKNYIRDHFKFGCISLDIWVDNFFYKSYICFNLFFINNDLELVQILLDAKEIKPPHTE